jgi:hypothetical protein
VHRPAAWFSFSSFRAVPARGREQDDVDGEASREQPCTEEERTGLMMVELSNAMVQLYKDLFGRGPTKTRTSLRRGVSEVVEVQIHDRLAGARTATVSDLLPQQKMRSPVGSMSVSRSAAPLTWIRRCTASDGRTTKNAQSVTNDLWLASSRRCRPVE